MDRIDVRSRFQRRPLQPTTRQSAMTYHAAAPQSVIDWIIVSTDWQFADYAVVPSLLSDHRMVVAEIVPAPKAE